MKMSFVASWIIIALLQWTVLGVPDGLCQARNWYKPPDEAVLGTIEDREFRACEQDYEQGRYEDAKQGYLDLLRRGKLIGDPMGLARASKGIAKVYTMLADPVKALGYLERATSRYRSRSYEPESVSRVYPTPPEPERAVRYLDDTRHRCWIMRVGLYGVDCLYESAEVAKRFGFYDYALQKLREYRKELTEYNREFQEYQKEWPGYHRKLEKYRENLKEYEKEPRGYEKELDLFNEDMAEYEQEVNAYESELAKYGEQLKGPRKPNAKRKYRDPMARGKRLEASILHEMGNHAEALEIYEQLLEERGDAKTTAKKLDAETEAELLLEKAYVLRSTGSPEKADKEYRSCCKAADSDSAIRLLGVKAVRQLARLQFAWPSTPVTRCDRSMRAALECLRGVSEEKCPSLGQVLISLTEEDSPRTRKEVREFLSQHQTETESITGCRNRLGNAMAALSMARMSWLETGDAEKDFETARQCLGSFMTCWSNERENFNKTSNFLKESWRKWIGDSAGNPRGIESTRSEPKLRFPYRSCQDTLLNKCRRCLERVSTACDPHDKSWFTRLESSVENLKSFAGWKSPDRHIDTDAEMKAQVIETLLDLGWYAMIAARQSAKQSHESDLEGIHRLVVRLISTTTPEAKAYPSYRVYKAFYDCPALMRMDAAVDRQSLDHAIGEFRAILAETLPMEERFLAHTGLGLAYERLSDLEGGAERYSHLEKAEKAYERAISVERDLRESIPVALRTAFYEQSIVGVDRMTPYEHGIGSLLRRRKGKRDEKDVDNERVQRAIEISDAMKARGFAELLGRRAEDRLKKEKTDLQSYLEPSLRSCRQECCKRLVWRHLRSARAHYNEDRHINEMLSAGLRELNEAYKSKEQQRIEAFEQYVQDLRDRLETHKGRMRQFSLETLKFANARYVDLLWPKEERSPSLKDLVNVGLDDNETALIYEITGDGVYLFICRKGYPVHPVILGLPKPFRYAKHVLKNKVIRFTESLEALDEQSPDWVTGKELSNLLLEPAIEHIRPGTDKPGRKPKVIIIPDEFLAEVPFSALPMPDAVIEKTERKEVEANCKAERKAPQYGATPRCFGSHYDVLYYPSLCALGLSRYQNWDVANTGDALVLADPEPRPGRTSACKGREDEEDETAGSKDLEGNNVLDSKGNRVEDLEANVVEDEATSRRGNGRTGGAKVHERPAGQISPREIVCRAKDKILRTKDWRKLAKVHGPHLKRAQCREASELRLAKPDLRRFRTLAFFTHGVGTAPIADPDKPYVILANLEKRKKDNERINKRRDGKLTFSEITYLHTRADPVVLVACETGLGRHISGEGIMSVGRAFLYAGARSMVASLWQVPKGSGRTYGVTFLNELYLNRDESNRLTIAEQQAVEAVKKVEDQSEIEWKHPKGWAPFIVVGDREPRRNELMDKTQAEKDRELVEACREPESGGEGKFNKVWALLYAGANPNGRSDTKFGYKPLHWAAFWGNKKVAEVLLNRGARMDAAGRKDGRTPLILAAREGHEKVVKMMLRRFGPDPRIEDKSHATAMDYALRQGHHGVVAMLRKYLNSHLWLPLDYLEMWEYRWPYLEIYQDTLQDCCAQLR